MQSYNIQGQDDIDNIIKAIRSKNRFLSAKTILKAIEICKVNQKDNLGRTINSFIEAVYYRANQIWLACGNIYG